MEDLIGELFGCYREDLRDYQIIIDKMKTLANLLENKPEPTDVKKNRTDQLLEQELTAFAVLRDSVFQGLQERSGQVKKIQKELCRKIDIADFHLSKIKPYLKEEVFQELVFLMAALDKKMKEVLALDDRLIPRLRLELEAVKLELHRLQDAKKTKNAYGNAGLKEARFIDKTK